MKSKFHIPYHTSQFLNLKPVVLESISYINCIVTRVLLLSGLKEKALGIPVGINDEPVVRFPLVLKTRPVPMLTDSQPPSDDEYWIRESPNKEWAICTVGKTYFDSIKAIFLKQSFLNC